MGSGRWVTLQICISCNSGNVVQINVLNKKIGKGDRQKDTNEHKPLRNK